MPRISAAPPPPLVISPAVISSRPATIRSVVGLPPPEGPTSTTNSLSRTWRFTSLTACTSSYFLLRSFIITCAIVWSPGPVTSGFRAARRAARDVVVHEERVEGHGGQRRQQRPCHQPAPVIDVPFDQARHRAGREHP